MSYEGLLLSLIRARAHGVVGASAGTLSELQHATGLAPLSFVEAIQALRMAQMITVSGDGQVRFIGQLDECSRPGAA